jgi:hypothetical protein
MKKHTNLSIKLILIVLMVFLFWLILSDIAVVEVEASKAQEIAYAANYDVDETEEYLTQIRTKQAELEKLEAKVASDLAHYEAWEEEYFYATKVFQYFMQRGFTKEAACAIIGNMMIETSGGDLNLKPNIYSKSGNYYGLCQWSLKYYPETKDISFEQQLDYLFNTMPWEFNTFGWLYEDGFDYEDFIRMTDPAEAALAFAKVYERCTSISYKLRENAAIKAYKYFDLKAPII